MTENDRLRSREASLLVIECDEKCDLDRFSGWLADAAVQVEVFRPHRGQKLPTKLDHDGLIVLGGELSALDDEHHPWLADIRSLQRSAHHDSIPSLGICLGAQLLAQAMGGTVEPGEDGFEIGLISVQLRHDAERDPLFNDVDTSFLAPSFHMDAITRLPPEAQWLADGETYLHQAFRTGTSWGVQFHPEITPSRLRRWNRIAESLGAATKEDLEAIAQRFDDEDSRVELSSNRIAANFISLLRSSAMTIEQAKEAL
ncbi:type 1 glutamine amidotransferase [Brevibacterium sp. 'Marine']|uniref:type 1 glutamine amidotransferase n=1 Tax=Brevibacterium sp. 'Marine' TaxID=2725563 RepID=UPI00145E2E11|nr:type 1 glutamine amidotransferase [Brevibacterium sp. 'Marine']